MVTEESLAYAGWVLTLLMGFLVGRSYERHRQHMERLAEEARKPGSGRGAGLFQDDL